MIKRIGWSKIPEKLKEQAIQLLRLAFGDSLLVFKYDETGEHCLGIGRPKCGVEYDWDYLSTTGVHAAMNTLVFHPVCYAVARWENKGFSPGALLEEEPWVYSTETLAEEKFKTSMSNLIIIGWNEIT